MSEKNIQPQLKEKKEHHAETFGIFFEAQQLLYSKDSQYQKIEVFENKDFGRILFLDGLVQTTEWDEFFYHEMLVHPALIVHPNPKEVLVIGGGDGGALKEILRYKIKHAFLVEIDSKVIEVSLEYFPWLSQSLKNEKVELLIEDGIKFIEKTEKMFDVVFVDSSEPVGPSYGLHEKDFYMKLKERLKHEGIVIAQVGSPIYHLDFIKKKATFLKDIFKVVRFYIGFVPTYPGGNWCYAFLSDEIDPFSIKRNPPPNLKYYNLDIHSAAFALPNFMKKI
ncbi:MAG: polyamine aminopropyltransferase [Candidatus Aminicenantes bacterium]|nr:polyamine aminopropyltransferase [Candidatus Aminicenantes bacterium]